MKEAFESAFSKNPDINPAFRETLTESLKKHSESGKSLDEIRKDERTKIHQTEEQLAKLSRFEKFISAWLDRYNLHANIRKNEAGNLEIPLTNISEIIPELPEGYGYKGSAARTIMQYALGMQFESPRDLDIVFFGSDENPEVSKELAMKYMPDDYLGGHGVERAEPDYFKTRDFTINEVRYDGERVEFTLQCLKDLLRNIVRFSKYEKQESYRGDKFFVKPKLLAKAIRLVAESESRGKKNARLADETLDLNHMYIDDFHMSLHLDRAMQRGEDVAERYVSYMVQNKYLPEDIISVADAFEYLIGQTDFVFRCSPYNEIDSEDTYLEELEKEFELETYTSPAAFWRK